MSIVSDFAVSVIAYILERSCTPVKQRICHLVRYRSNVRNLMERVQTLKAVRDDVQELVKAGQDKGEKIKSEVSNWLAHVIQIELDVETLEDKFNKNERQDCCFGWCPDWSSRHQLSRSAKKKTEEINVLLSKGKFDGVSLPAATPGVDAMPTPDFVPLESSMLAIDEIIKTLKDELNNISVIGVCGAGGIGKTTLMKQVAKRAKEHNLFDDVAIATVSRNPNLKEIQCEIAELIGLRIEEESLLGRATRLSDRLKQKSKVLVILDDLWERLELENVGIPYGNEHNVCKIVVTSRSSKVCSDMDAKKIIKIKELSSEDSWSLFTRKAEDLIHSPTLCQAAWKIVGGCGGNPNSIVTVARALRNKTLDVWNNAVQTLGECRTTSSSGVPVKVVLCLKFSYDQIENEAAKQCLWFCCLFPEYYSVTMEELVVYGLVDRLFPEAGTLAEVRTGMLSVVDFLKSANFLLEADREGSFKVHDDTRDVVTSIASERGYNLMVKALTAWPAEGLESCKRMSLIDRGIRKLPDKPECPQLLTLFLQNNAFENIPDSFFQSMRALQFLDFSYTYISSLPRSIQCLEGLLSLRLENTHLRDASLLNKLNKLEVLILRGSRLEQLPKGLEKMTNLKLLDLSDNSYLQGIPSNVISKLSQLEELYIGNSFGDWEIEGDGSQNKANFSDVAALARLTVLHIQVKNAKCLSINFDGRWEKLQKFRICVSNDYSDITSAKSMHLKNLSYPIANWVKLLLEKAEHLVLTRSMDLEDIMQKDVQSLNGLKSLHLRACNMNYVFRSHMFQKVENLEELHIEYCYSLKEVFHLEEIEEENAKLTRLRELILVGLPNLMSIWNGNLSVAHLENLNVMKVEECWQLRNLFSEVLARRLRQLEHLAIINCDNMEEIISNQQAEKDEAACMMNLSNIPPPRPFQNLQKLIISKCKKMKRVLSVSLVRGLEQLEELTIVECNQIEEIITMAMGEEDNKEGDQNMLPQLKILTLQNLPKLGTICNDELLLEWPSLRELQVWNCRNLKKLPLGLYDAPRLRKIKGHLTWVGGLEWKDENAKRWLQPLLTEERSIR
ncbi:hypothetical protein F0562_010119 [Nyssa sinensis]|uniref:Uncharacterized protein n=1 Tax=Nyssa sinensis TaxID=561372 RepID=A0A5J5A0T8_9ASTE|nr:hypothetical protein F0562_010119 [Nyssa sinensis]